MRSGRDEFESLIIAWAFDSILDAILTSRLLFITLLGG